MEEEATGEEPSRDGPAWEELGRASAGHRMQPHNPAQHEGSQVLSLESRHRRGSQTSPREPDGLRRHQLNTTATGILDKNYGYER